MGAGITITFESLEQLQQMFESTLSRGGAFAPGETGFSQDECIDVTLVHPTSAGRMRMTARVVWVAPEAQGGGVGIELDDFTPDTRNEIAAWIEAESKKADRRPKKTATNVHERLRNISVAEQQKIARRGTDVNERIVLERIYGKPVWEALISNPRLTPPEVIRIVRMRGVPRPLLEQIVANPAWLNTPQVRRALLANHRLPRDLMFKVLRATPKPELKLAQKQTAYPMSVRQAAKHMLDSGG